MRLIATAACAALFLSAPAHYALAAGKPPIAPDARERIPEGLLGIWKVDPAQSTKPATPASLQLRSFQYTKEGKLLVNFMIFNVDGTQLFGNWEVQLDGTPGYEYRSDNRSTPVAEIRLTKIDEHNLQLSNSVAGVEESKSFYKISDDRQTFTMTQVQRTGTKNVFVYKRWDGR